MQNRYFAYFPDFSHIGVDFRILICEFAYAWRPCSTIILLAKICSMSLGPCMPPKMLALNTSNPPLPFWLWEDHQVDSWL